MNRSFKYLVVLAGIMSLALVCAAMLLRPIIFPPPPPGPFAMIGGEFFPRKWLNDVPQFFQNDNRWKNKEMGTSGSFLGPEGCAVTCAAMVLSGNGVVTDPKKLNQFLSINGGYTPEGWIYWEKAAELADGRLHKSYEDIGSHELLDQAILNGLTPIIKIQASNSVSHFVVVVGKSGHHYLIRDPSRRGKGKVVWLDRYYNGDIQGVRLYEKVPHKAE